MFRKITFLSAVLLSTLPCFAQQRGGRGGGRGPRSAVELVGVAQVMEDLKVSEEQKASLDKLATEIQETRQAQRDNDADEQDRAARGRQRAEQAKQLATTFKPKIAAILDEDQMQRLQQITWQAMGIRALADESAAKALELSKETSDKISAAIAEAPSGRGASSEERQAATEKLTASLTALLSDEQKEKWNELKGAKFDISVLSQRRGGPGRGQGGQGRGQGGQGRGQGGQGRGQGGQGRGQGGGRPAQ